MFEGVEKRIELRFFQSNLREKLDNKAIVNIVTAAGASILDKVETHLFDSYILSESSLFIYDDRIIVITCGLTSPLLATPLIVSTLNCSPISVDYSRTEFMFPENQKEPHRSFEDEVLFLRKQAFLNKGTERITNSNETYTYSIGNDNNYLQKIVFLQCKFPENYQDIIISLLDCYMISYHEHRFEPQGYSMNGFFKGGGYVTIHVSPEDAVSYLSLEFYNSDINFEPIAFKFLNILKPKKFNTINFTFS